MELYQVGNLAKSLAGHDKDEIYVIVAEEREYVYLANGETRRVEHPKKKKKKHVQPISYQMPANFQNEEMKRAIKQYKQED